MSANAAYRGFASIYDETMGEAAVPVIWSAFERACEQFGIRFRAAADVGCGTGLFLERLASSGAVLFGVDLSEAMLARAARRLRGTRVRLLKQDMRELTLPQRVDLITCNFCTLNYTSNIAELEAAAMRMRHNLAPRGWLIADLLSDVGPLPHADTIVQDIRLPRARSRWRIELDPSGRGSVVRMHTIDRSETRASEWREQHRQRWYSPAAVLRALRDAGIEPLGVRRMPNLERGTPDDRWIQIVGRTA